MNNWMEGYNSDTTYTNHYYLEISPEFLNLMLILNQLKPIPLKKGFSYLELGCGYGLSTLINAAHNPQATFYGLDYSPAQIASAKVMAKKAGLTNIHFLENSFQDIVDNPSLLPSFDFITFHGIYTWVSDTNRDNLVKICSNHLNTGGLVYNSYNSKPGWSGDGEVLQKLLYGLAHEQKGLGIEKLEGVFSQIDEILKLDLGFLKDKKEQLKRRFKGVKEKDKRYISHEYLHEDWRAFFFSEVEKSMQSAKLTYLTQASLVEHLSHQFCSKELLQELKETKSSTTQELIGDIVHNIQFRRDIYIRGDYGELSIYNSYELLKNQKWMLLKRDEIKEYNFTVNNNKIIANREPFDSIIKVLKEGAISLEAIMKRSKTSYTDTIKALTLLFHNHYVAPLYEHSSKEDARVLNHVIVDTLFENMPTSYISYPYLNLAIKEHLMHRVFLKALYAGSRSPMEIVNYSFNLFTSQGRVINLKNKQLKGKRLKAYFKEEEVKWRKEKLPLWVAAGVVEMKNSSNNKEERA